MKPASLEAVKLFHEGTLAFSEMEANGVYVDLDYLKRAERKITKKIHRLEERMQQDRVWELWQSTYGGKAKMSAREQLGKILVKLDMIPEIKLTQANRIATDRNVLEGIDHPFIYDYMEVERLKKARSTYIRAAMKAANADGLVRPFWNLHIATSYRSSCDKPNLQNVPIRNPEIAAICRRAFIPGDENYCIVEIDFSGIEVRVSACYNQDPVLIDYLMGKGDMHRDSACEIFECRPEQVSKAMRDVAKNQYVFPNFYGSYFKNTAPDMWESIIRRKLTIQTKKGEIGVKKWLSRKGIKELGNCKDREARPEPGTFEEHVAGCENILWNERFTVYRDWKKSYYNQYLRKGYVKSLTGFVYDSEMDRKQVSNYPIQGSAFHCLLWSLIMIIRMIRKYKLRAQVFGQIHDSVLARVHKDDVPAYVENCHKIMTKRIRKRWDWITIPLAVEAEVSPPGRSWYEKKSYELN